MFPNAALTKSNHQSSFYKSNQLDQQSNGFSQSLSKPSNQPAPIVVVVANGQMDQLEVAVNQNGNDTKVTINSNPKTAKPVNSLDQSEKRYGSKGLQHVSSNESIENDNDAKKKEIKKELCDP